MKYFFKGNCMLVEIYFLINVEKMKKKIYFVLYENK